MFVFRKIRNIVLTEKKVFIFNKKDIQPRYTDDYSDIMGVTLSLLIGAKNLILHVATRADEEWSCERRQELIEIIASRY